MKCDCYSAMTGKGKDKKVLKAPEWSSKKEIAVDYCIAEAIQFLWKNGCITRGCCCGHNKATASIIFDSPEDAIKARGILNWYYEDSKFELLALVTARF